jgi:tetratricopeptide (TPR) repeat protein
MRQQPDAALPLIMAAISKQPRNPTLHVIRAELLEQKFGADRATAALIEAEKIVGDVAEIRAARARLMAERADRSQAPALAAMSQNVESFTADDRQRVVREVIAGFRLLDDADNVARMLHRLAAVRPDDFACREALVSIARRNRDVVRLQVLLQEIESLEGKNGPCLKRLEAQRIIWVGKPDQLPLAEQCLASAAEHRPTDPAIPFLRGRIAELRGDANAARMQYRIAFDRGFLEAPLEELLLDVPGESRTAPAAALQSELATRLSIETSRSMVVAALPLLDSAARDRLAERLTAQCSPNHAAQQAWLGRLFAKMGLTNRAEAAFRRIAPNSPDGWLALLAERAPDSAKFDAACAEVRQAMSPIEANLVIGKALESARRWTDARRCYEDAAQMKPDDPRALRALAALAIQTGQISEACKTLEALCALSEAKHPEDVRWARRNLALQLAFSPSLASFQKSMNLLDRNRLPEGWVADDLRARALVLATQKNRPLADGKTTARREAITLLETLQERSRTRSADDLVLLAKLYRAENDEVKFRSACERMRSEHAGHYGSLEFLAREAIRELDATGCEKLLPGLRQLGPGRFDTLAIEFQYWTLVGEGDRARKLLTDYAVSSPTPAEQAQREIRLANFVHDFLAVAPMADRTAAAGELRSLAIRWFSNRMEKDPERMQRQCGLLAQNGQGGQALDWLLDKARGTFSAEAIAAAQVTVLRHGKATDLQKQAVGRSLVDATEKNPKSPSLQVSLADFYQITGQKDQAITIYRKVLAADPNNVVALNNLAWTMAGDQRSAAEALVLVQRAIDLVGPLDDLLDTRARIQFESGDVQAALRDLTEAVSEVPTATRLVELASMHRKAGQTDAADRALQKARLYAHNAEAPAPR